MRHRGLGIGIGVLLVSSLVAAQGTAPTTSDQIVIRGQSKLDSALRVALGSALEERPTKASILLVVDVTPYVQLAEVDLRDALLSLDAVAPAGSSWRIAALGASPSEPVGSPGSLAGVLGRTIAEETRAPSTFAALRKTLSRFGSENATIVYLADWHFEDDADLEDFVAELRRHRQRLSVVGTEACFNHAWNDGFFPPNRGQRNALGRSELYDAAIGRSPFGTNPPEAPWRGGDVAAPRHPWHLHGAWWNTRFHPPVVLDGATDGLADAYGRRRASAKDAAESKRLEDLGERLRALADPSAPLLYPLPSSFPPYALARVVAETKGRYVLWSWNPGGRTDVVYDAERCDAFPPDLRSRAEILADSRRQPIARAIYEAWNRIAADDVIVGRVTPPIDDRLEKGVPLAEPLGRLFLGFGWQKPSDRPLFIANAEKTIVALDEAITRLDRALHELAPRPPSDATPKPARDAIERRWVADADLLRHTLLTHRFTIGEALVAAKSPAAAQPLDGKALSLLPVTWIPENPGGVTAEPEAVPLRDPARGALLLADRRRFLERYQRTPFGELVSRNRVQTIEVELVPIASGNPKSGTTPAETKPTRPATPGTGSSAPRPSTTGGGG